MKIVVLDGYTLNPGDLSWEALEAIGEVKVYDRTPASETIKRAEGCEVILSNKTLLMEAELAQLPDLRYVGLLATGYNTVDVKYAGSHGITVTNVPAYSTPSVAQHTFALLLEMTNHVQSHSDIVREGEWSRSVDFSFWTHPMLELAGKTIGIIGVGQIGKKAAEIARAFGMNVLGYDTEPSGDCTFVGLDELLRESDFVSLHCPLFAENTKMVNAEFLSKMKNSAFLINTSRGGLVDDQALADALNAETIAGAGLDVLTTEPPAADNPLLSAKNCIITPHIAWASRAARSRLMDAIADNLRHYLDGNPKNVVSEGILT